ncbi:hypothetical protein [Promicromonospora aerolata]|uniref:ABC transmembrane type-1 domain-containing protein n=1 Tax=Promicromonospora aerolata TaxID=195749 RepID=A0ABW4VEN3_9MICO
MRKATTDAGLTVALRVIPEVTQGIALVVGAYLVAQGDMTLGTLVAFFATAAVINGPVVDLGMTLSMTLNARTAVDRFFEVMDTTNPITDPAAPADVPVVTAGAPARRAGTSPSATSRSAMPTPRAPCSTTSTWSCRPAPRPRWSASPAPASRRSRCSRPASST